MSRQLIIVFEGIECSGKSYHIKKIEKLLIKNKKKYISLREPGGSHNSEKIRKIILNNKSNFNKFTDLLLYLAARNENIQQIIKKNYKKKIILIDRFIDSTIAYQHYGMGIDIKIINDPVNTGNCFPSYSCFFCGFTKLINLSISICSLNFFINLLFSSSFNNSSINLLNSSLISLPVRERMLI